jgi:predicted DNA-binding protein
MSMRHTSKPRTALKTLSIKVPRTVSARIAQLARERGTTVSAVVRDALETYPGSRLDSFGELAKEYIGSLAGGPGDLATNPKHLKGYGTWRR